ncbi:MAG: hypothetical protein FWG75_08440 [Cystobacterineae bacterium]|nr:hypothetical protein [Cystobacterineae bacterium]
MFDFKKCHPVELDEPVRVGNKNDGGYVLSRRHIERTKTVLSFGIKDDWMFEADFSKRKKIKVYSYDYSTKRLPFLTKKFAKTYAAIAYNLFFLKFSRAKVYYKHLSLAEEFYRFFNADEGRFFIPKFLGEYDGDNTVCFDTVFKGLGEVEDLSVFLKMDIEGGEFFCLPQLVPYFNKLNGMAIEFHNLAVNAVKFDALLDDLGKHFYVSHVHGNNYGKLIAGTDIPSTLEMTFIHKSIVQGNASLSKRDYPLEGIDAPCKKNKGDYKLVFPEH